MRVGVWNAIAVATLSLTLFSLVGQSQAGPADPCCVCNRCDGIFSCSAVTSPDACAAFCTPPQNSTTCGFEVFNSSCAAVAECPAGAPLGAPALGEGGLTAVALVLAGLGVLGLRQAARRKRA